MIETLPNRLFAGSSEDEGHRKGIVPNIIDGDGEAPPHHVVMNRHDVGTSQTAARNRLEQPVQHLPGQLAAHRAGVTLDEDSMSRAGLPRLRVGIETVKLEVGYQPPGRDEP